MRITKYFNWFTVTLTILIYVGVNFWNGTLVSAWFPFTAFILIVAKLTYNGIYKGWLDAK